MSLGDFIIIYTLNGSLSLSFLFSRRLAGQSFKWKLTKSKWRGGWRGLTDCFSVEGDICTSKAGRPTGEDGGEKVVACQLFGQTGFKSCNFIPILNLFLWSALIEQRQCFYRWRKVCRTETRLWRALICALNILHSGPLSCLGFVVFPSSKLVLLTFLPTFCCYFVYSWTFFFFLLVGWCKLADYRAQINYVSLSSSSLASAQWFASNQPSS